MKLVSRVHSVTPFSRWTVVVELWKSKKTTKLVARYHGREPIIIRWDNPKRKK